MELEKMEQGANEEYSQREYVKHGRCALLTDEGRCECPWCWLKGWPKEVAELAALEEMDSDEEWELTNLGPREGRERYSRTHAYLDPPESEGEQPRPGRAERAEKRAMIEEAPEGVERAKTGRQKVLPAEQEPKAPEAQALVAPMAPAAPLAPAAQHMKRQAVGQLREGVIRGQARANHAVLERMRKKA